MNWNEYNDTLSLSCYYVAKENILMNRISGECSTNIKLLMLGMLVQANEILADGSLRIRIFDSKNNDKDWNKTEWRCDVNKLISVSSIIWHYLIAVSSPQERVKIAIDNVYCDNAKNLKVGNKVWYLSPDRNKYKAVIKKIEPIQEFGPGFYFCLELLEKPDDYHESLISKKLCGPNGIVTRLNHVLPRRPDDTDDTEKNKLKFNKQDIDETLTKQLDGFLNLTSKNNDKKINQDDKLICNISLDNPDNSNNKNIYNIKEINEHLNEALVPKILHQSTKSKILSNDKINFKNIDYPSIDDLVVEKKESSRWNKRVNGQCLYVGNSIEVFFGSEIRCGIIRWIGNLPGLNPEKIIAAVELKDGPHYEGTDGTYNNIRYFNCQPNRAIFVDINQCYLTNTIKHVRDFVLPTNDDDNLDRLKPSVISGIVGPICIKGDIEKICGKYRGIQGHHNSCYLDATLFSMFAFTCVFDSLLFRPRNEYDCPEYEEVQRVLREEIVNPLRKNIFVEASQVMKLRKLLEKLSSISGLTSEEKDPEEFLTSLVAQILNAEPFLKLNSGQNAYHYQLFVEKDDDLKIPTVQQLLEQSFFTSNVRLKEVPSCLIIQMPRFGKSYKMYQKIQPTLLLDVTDIIEDSPRQCTVCGKCAEYECKECYGQCGDGLESTAFCYPCLKNVHQHEKRINHKPTVLSIPEEFTILPSHCPVPRLYLELSAVVCIETSHYVSFVKCGSGSEAPWCFFDSMADRIGEQNGYNIPEMVPCPTFPYWLSEEGANYLADLTDDRQLPEHAKRLLCDAYMCMYQSPEVMMYK
ncbi:hypothetical protein HCN44_001594 [Aphidius gifuensis]|uniref:ubiquitinyl hydrolase 1 n=1 Tax=Aphidius gifuensis TaxID=684658 RepID=A0A835CQY4_APHGI|nr:ubiquitin carboxyl-terminal hydrolase CYLD [Aphidius gifuensis]KAF7992269.1 hypothetical protein HCN44_001594 [Aphidius gifuensis]